MVALVAALRGLHLAQQRVHFFQGQASVGAYRPMAGHAGEQFVVGTLDHGAGLVLTQLCQHATRQLNRVPLGQRRGH